MKLVLLTKGFSAMVDDEDYKRVSAFFWCADVGRHGTYAMRRIQKPNGQWTSQRMHNFIMGEVGRIDHKNRNGLDNRRENLRPATPLQNRHNEGLRKTNTSGFKGVTYFKRDQKWKAQIRAFGKQRHIGVFDTPEQAAQAYNVEAKKVQGEFAVLNPV